MSLIFENLTFFYKDQQDRKILDNFNLELTPQARIGVYGKKGTGKSTILKILNGEINNYSGTISIDGKSIAEMNNTSAKISLLFQNPEKQFIFPKIKDEYKFIVQNRKDATEKRIKKISYVFNFNLAEIIKSERTIFDLSSGEIRLLQIIFTLARDMNYYIMDEPFQYLDDEDRLHFVNYLNELNNYAILFLSSKKKVLQPLSERIINF